MARSVILFHLIVAAVSVAMVDISLIASPAHAENAENPPVAAAGTDSARLATLFARLQAPGEGWRLAETEILQIWSRSGSAAMDLLLARGTEALDGGDVTAALGHLTALTDHAPDFAEGWAVRAAALASAGLPGPAAADIARTLQLEPRHFAALTLLCQILAEMEDAARAEAACRASLAIHPHQQEAIDLLSLLQARREGVLM